jgi:hypothetical protein
LDENDRVQLFGTINSSRKLSKTPIVDSRIILKSSIFHHLSEKTVSHHLSAAFFWFQKGKGRGQGVGLRSMCHRGAKEGPVEWDIVALPLY